MPVKAVKITVTASIGRSFSEFKKRLIGSGIWMDFTKPELSDRLNGRFTESPLTWPIEASNYDTVTIVFLFTEANKWKYNGHSVIMLTSVYL